MKEPKKVEWNDLKTGGYYRIVYNDEKMNVRDKEDLDLLNVYKLECQPNDFARKYKHELKEYPSYDFNSISLFDSNPGINLEIIKKGGIKEIYELSHDDLIFEVTRIWMEEQEEYNKPKLLSRISNPAGEEYLQLHFKAMYNFEIQIIAAMSEFFTGTYEIMRSTSIENGIVVEIPLICDNGE